ncbi:MAG: helix-turn-helix domain-containing protein [Oscillospiraceae bacterium]
MTTGEKIKRLRKEQKISQEQLADTLGLSRQAVSRWETENAIPETAIIIKLSDIFHVSTDYLLKENEDMNLPLETRIGNNEAKKTKKNLVIGITGIAFDAIVLIALLFMSLANPELRVGSNGEIVNVWNLDFWASNQLIPFAIILILAFVIGVYYLGNYYFHDWQPK